MADHTHEFSFSTGFHALYERLVAVTLADARATNVINENKPGFSTQIDREVVS
jgi:hypothetical protein